MLNAVFQATVVCLVFPVLAARGAFHKCVLQSPHEQKWWPALGKIRFTNSGSLTPAARRTLLSSQFAKCQKFDNKEPISKGLFYFISVAIKAWLKYKTNSQGAQVKKNQEYNK